MVMLTLLGHHFLGKLTDGVKLLLGCHTVGGCIYHTHLLLL